MPANKLDLAFEAFGRRDAAETERLCRQVLASNPQELNALQMLAEVLAFTNRSAEAVSLFRQIVQITQGLLAVTSVENGLNTLRSLNWRPKGILDIGAHRGHWTQMARHFFPDSFVLMIEAQPMLQPVLSEMVASQPDKIALRPVLLGPERRDSVDFFQMDGASTSGSSLYEEQTAFGRSIIKLPMLPLDDVLAEFPDRSFQLMKIDVQGAELDVLKGATSTLPGIEVIMAELSLVEYNKGAPLFADIVTSLNDLGFPMFDIYALPRHPSGALIQVDAFFIRQDSPLWPKPPFY